MLPKIILTARRQQNGSGRRCKVATIGERDYYVWHGARVRHKGERDQQQPQRVYFGHVEAG